MRAILGMIIGLTVFVCAVSAPANIVIETVPIGNLGNPSDTEVGGYGAVAYTYDMGKFEITAGQYTEFLNAVADTDTYGLYQAPMYDNLQGCKIQRTGVSGSYSYSVAADRTNRPVNYIKFSMALRFANWMHNGQPTGAQGLSTTEDGSYYLNGATTNPALDLVVREPDATWVLPSDNEWYKAAYHKNDGVTGNYWDYPTSSDSVPSNVLGTPTDPGNNATFRVTGGSPVDTIGSPYWRTEFGAHENSDSPYGTFDQGGNVAEWSEGRTSTTSRRTWGGSYTTAASSMLASNPTGASSQGNVAPSPSMGIRLALIPEPATIVLLALGCLGMVRRRR